MPPTEVARSSSGSVRLRACVVAALLVSLVPAVAELPGTFGAAAVAKSAGTWRLTTPPPPGPNADVSMVYDPAAHQIVMFGGDNGGSLVSGGTWIWDGHQWLAPKLKTQPPGRTHAMMVYDTNLRLVVLFGGEGNPAGGGSGLVPLNDTWTWDGRKWTNVTSKSSSPPTARYDAGMVYDDARGRVILFGGTSTGSNSFADTWQWGGQGETWSTVPTTGPAARSKPGLVYDADSRQVVLFGGNPVGSGATGEDPETWVLTPTGGWTDTKAGGPAARQNAGMTFDAAHRVVVLVGGSQNGKSDDLPDTWLWDGKAWTKAQSLISPPRFNAGITYDAACRCVLLVGGQSGAGIPISDSWQWDGKTWRATVPHPNGRWTGMGITYDADTQQVVIFGGFADVNATFPSDETWTWGRRGWRESTTNGPPSDGSWHLAFDAARRRLVAFSNGSVLAETWTWDGHRWKVPAYVSPPDDSTFSIDPLYAYDAKARQLVAFFGTDPYFRLNAPGHTMVWNGRLWRPITSGPEPTVRAGQSMVYDPATGQLLLFGGFGCVAKGMYGTGAGPDGVDTPPVTTPPVTTPGVDVPGVGPVPPYHWPQVTWLSPSTIGPYSPGRDYIYCSDTWIWNGHRWSKQPGPAALARGGALLAYDSAHRDVLLFGGTGNGPGSDLSGNISFSGQIRCCENGRPGLTDTWTWDGHRWKPANTQHHPPALQYDTFLTSAPGVGKLVLGHAPVDHGVEGKGVDAPAGDQTTDTGTWVWNGRDWADLSKTQPSPGSAVVEPHVALGGVLLYGGYNNVDTYFWKGHGWVRQAGGSAPYVGVKASTYDPAVNRVVALANTGFWTWGR